MYPIPKLNSELRAEARETLQGVWFDAALVTLVYMLLYGICGVLHRGSLLLYILLANPIFYGYRIYGLNLIRGQKGGVGTLFEGFNDYKRVVLTLLLRDVYVLLWTCLLVVPGIMKSYSYAMTTYIMIDNPDMAYNDAIEESMAMMEGHKMRLFRLDLSFIGWYLLGIITFGIGLLFVVPYLSITHAAFYEDLRANV